MRAQRHLHDKSIRVRWGANGIFSSLGMMSSEFGADAPYIVPQPFVLGLLDFLSGCPSLLHSFLPPTPERPPATAKSKSKRPRTTRPSDRERQATANRPRQKSIFKLLPEKKRIFKLLPRSPHIWQIAISGDIASGVLYFYRIIYFYNGFFNFENFSHKTSTQRKILRNYQKTSRILIKIENMYAYDYFSLFLKNVRDSH